MKTLLNLVGGTFLLLIVITAFAIVPADYLRTKTVDKITLPGEKYTAGEIVYPDYAHEDTLIVVDPVGLNKAIEQCDGTDYEISTALHRYCAILGEQMPEYGIDIDQNGYFIHDRCYHDTITVKWGTNFDSLMYNWND